MKVGVVLVAGGRGVRLGARVPKAWVPLAGAPLFAHALSAFHDLPWVRRIAVVMEPAWVGRARNLLRALGSTKVSAVVAGARAVRTRWRAARERWAFGGWTRF